MKKTILSLVCLASFALSEAQSTEEALRLSLNRPAGTARNMALSGAMGALGGDYSSLLTNPAGIAVYRSSEFTFTPSLHLNNSSTEFYGLGSNDDRIGVPFQQIAFVGTFKPVREAESGLISTHFWHWLQPHQQFQAEHLYTRRGIAIIPARRICSPDPRRPERSL